MKPNLVKLLEASGKLTLVQLVVTVSTPCLQEPATGPYSVWIGPNPHPQLRSTLILSSNLRLGLLIGHLPLSFQTKFLYALLILPIRVNGKSMLYLARSALQGVWRSGGIVGRILISLDRDDQLHVPAAFAAFNPWIGAWVSPSVGLHAMAQIHSPIADI